MDSDYATGLMVDASCLGMTFGLSKEIFLNILLLLIMGGAGGSE